MPEDDAVTEVARGLYLAWRGGKADWDRLTPWNKERWRRAARFALEDSATKD